MNRIMSSIELPVTAILLLLMMGLGGCGRNDDGESAIHPIAIRVTKPVISDMQNQLSYIGTVQSQREVQVIAVVQGTVVGLPFGERERVRKGDVVVRVDAPELEATAERLGAEVDYWCRRYESDQRLVAAEALPEEQMESSKRACRSARAALAEAESRLAKTVEVSPVDGEVLRWFVEPGQSVMPGQPILKLGDGRLEIQVEVAEEDLRRGIDVGTAADIEDGWGNRFASTVSEVAPMASGISRTFLVRLPVAMSRSANLRTGASVRVEFVLRTSQSVVIVPLNAIANRDTDPRVFVVREQRAFGQRVVLGIERDGWIEASFPWNGEDLVAVSNLSSLKDSISVFTVSVEDVRQ
jgi:RND family efflux transporter MFP subunit